MCKNFRATTGVFNEGHPAIAMNFFDEKLSELGAYPARGVDKYIPTPEDLLNFEKALSRPLPEDYRTAIADYVISFFQKGAQFSVPGGCPYGNTATLQYFFGLEPLDDDYGLENSQPTRAHGVPNDFVCIANALMGDPAAEVRPSFEVRLSLCESNCGRISLVPFTTKWVDTEISIKNYEDISYQVAGSFRGFIEGLEAREFPPASKQRKAATEERWIVWRAISDNDLATLEKFVETGRHLTWRDDAWGQTMCHLAARQGSIEALRLLLDNGAEIHGALSSAARAGNLTNMKYLLGRGADVNEQTQWSYNLLDYTPLLQVLTGYGTRRAKLRATHLLLEHGADPGIKNRLGYDAYWFFRRMPYLKVDCDPQAAT
jgi:hypothetical protein